MTRRRLVLVGWVAAALALVAGSFVAGRATLTPPAGEPEITPTASYMAQEDRLGRTATFRVSAQWSTTPLVRASTSGTVTSVGVQDGATIDAGEEVYTIDLRPTVVMTGPVPAFRTLERGIRGEDVAQLQDFLTGAGFATGSVDGIFGARTTQALINWQRSQGMAATGSLPLGSVIFVPDLPVRVMLSDDLRVGAPVSGGDVLLQSVASVPLLTVSEDANSPSPPAGTPVSVQYGEHTWEGIIGAPTDIEGDQPSSRLALESADGGAICEPECDAIPLHPQDGALSAIVEIVPERHGVVIPVAALEQDPAGDYFVRTTAGEQIDVTVSITDGSRVIVEGLEAGAEILIAVPGEATIAVDDDPVADDSSAPDHAGAARD